MAWNLVQGEYRLVYHKQEELEAAIIASGDIRSLARKMNSENLMSNSDCEGIISAAGPLNDRERAGLIVSILRDNVRTNRHNFYLFIEILKSNPVFSDILGVLGMKGKWLAIAK